MVNSQDNSSTIKLWPAEPADKQPVIDPCLINEIFALFNEKREFVGLAAEAGGVS